MPAARPDSQGSDTEAAGRSQPPFGSIANALESCGGFSIIAIDLGGMIRLWSQGAQRLYGYHRAEIIGQPSSVLHVDEDLARDLPAELIDHALRVKSWEEPVSRTRKDGSHFTARLSVTPLLRADGSPEGFLFVSSDMSEEERVAGELERERHSHRVLFEGSADAMITAGAAGKIQRANGAAEKLFGYAEAELVDRPVEMLMPAWCRDRHVNDRSASPPRRTRARWERA